MNMRRLYLVMVMAVTAVGCGDTAGGDDPTTPSSTAAVTTVGPAVSTTVTTSAPTTTRAPTTVEPRSLCEVDAELDEVAAELFAFDASPDRTAELVLEARALAMEAIAVAPPEVVDDVMTTAAAFGGLLDAIEDLDYDTSGLDNAWIAEQYAADEVTAAGARVDAWLSDTC